MNIFRKIYGFLSRNYKAEKTESAKLAEEELVRSTQAIDEYMRFLDNYESYPDKSRIIPQIGRFLLQGPTQLTSRENSFLDVNQILDIEERFNELREKYLRSIRKNNDSKLEIY